METVTRRKLPDLIQDVIDNGSHYEFYQLIRLLEKGWHGHGCMGNGLEKWLRMRPASELSFPASDIRRCQLEADGGIDLQLNFMGLYGVDTVLPQYFAEHAARGNDGGDVLRSFLDVFNHRFYTLFYQAWQKFHPYVNIQRTDAQYPFYLAALSGNPYSFRDSELKYCGLLGSRVRSAAGLQSMLKSALNGIPVRIREFVARWVDLQTMPRLGSEDEDSFRIGHTAVLGDQIMDVGGKIDIEIGPLPVSDALRLMPGDDESESISMLIQRYLDPALLYDLVIHVLPDEIKGLRLGDRTCCLGRSTWLGEHVGHSYALRIPGRCDVVNNINDNLCAYDEEIMNVA